MIRRALPYIVVVVAYLGLGYAIWRAVAPDSKLQVAESLQRGPVAEFNRISHQIGLENEKLQRLLIRDSMLAVLPDRPGLFVGARDTGIQSYLSHAVRRDVSDTSRVLLAVVAVPGDYGTHQHFAGNSPIRPQLIAGQRPNAPYCMISWPVFKYAPDGHEQLGYGYRSSPMLGPCRFWSKYGAPGPRIASWVEGEGQRFSKKMTDWDPSMERLRPDESQFKWLMRWTVTPRGLSCMAGRAQSCVDALTVPADTGRYTELTYARIMPGENTLLSDIETEFGADRFARFWTSSEEMPRAFQNAFGISLGDWTAHWAQQRVGRYHAGAALPMGTTLISLIVVGLFAGLATLFQNRRRV